MDPWQALGFVHVNERVGLDEEHIQPSVMDLKAFMIMFCSLASTFGSFTEQQTVGVCAQSVVTGLLWLA